MLIEKAVKKKVELYVSESVKELLACLPDEVTYPDMTALMELELDKIEAGNLTLDDYMQGQEDYIRQIIDLPSKFTPVARKMIIRRARYAAAASYIRMKANSANSGVAVIIKMVVRQLFQIATANLLLKNAPYAARVICRNAMARMVISGTAANTVMAARQHFLMLKASPSSDSARNVRKVICKSAAAGTEIFTAAAIILNVRQLLKAAKTVCRY